MTWLFIRRPPVGEPGDARGTTDDRARLGSAAPIRRDAPGGALSLRPERARHRTAPLVGPLS